MTFDHRALLVAIGFTSVVSFAQQAEPWHQVNAQPVRYPVVVVPQAESTSDDRSEALNAAQQIMQQMMGRSELVGGGTDDGGGALPPGQSSSIDVSGPAGDGPNGTQLVNVNGCTKELGRFQFRFGHGNESGCDPKLTISEELSDFMNSNLSRCAKLAAGINSFEVGKIHHAGTLPSKDHMAKSPRSLHNYGMAVDLTSIQMDNRKFVFANAKKDRATKQFVDKFRKCWGDAIESKRAGCLGGRRSGMPHGSIGQEDSDHQGHLHLSLPFCSNTAASLGGVNVAIMIFQSWFMNIAHAEEAPKKYQSDLPPPEFTYKTLAVPGGQAKLTVKNTHGEPISAGFRISLEITCTKSKQKVVLLNELEACSFDEIRYDKKDGLLKIFYRTSVFEEGRVVCRKSEVGKFKGRCP